MSQPLSATTLCEAFQNTSRARPKATALRTPGGGASISWSGYQQRVERIARGLAALGVSRGDTVGLSRFSVSSSWTSKISLLLTPTPMAADPPRMASR